MGVRAGPWRAMIAARSSGGTSTGSLWTSPSYSDTSMARRNTSSIIGGVSLPVKVFCWLGW